MFCFLFFTSGDSDDVDGISAGQNFVSKLSMMLSLSVKLKTCLRNEFEVENFPFVIVENRSSWPRARWELFLKSKVDIINLRIAQLKKVWKSHTHTHINI